MIVRRYNWLTRLTALVREVKNRPHVWGEWDCAIWTAAAIEAQTGVDLAEPYRGKYNDEASCMRVLREVGPGSLLALAETHFGERMNPINAWRGDVLYRDDHSLGIAYGPYGLFVGQLGEGELAQEGLIAFPLSEVRYSFRIPLSPEAAGG